MKGFFCNIKIIALLFITLFPALAFSTESPKLGCMMCHQGQRVHLNSMPQESKKFAHVRPKNS